MARDSYGGRSLPELASLAESVRMQSGTWVSYAMVDGATPSLVDVLERASFEGVDRLVVVPMSVPSERELLAWVSRCVGAWRASSSPRRTLAVHVAPSLAESAELVDAIQASCLAAISNASQQTDLGDREPNDPSWSMIPTHQHHVLVCRGPRCTMLGAGDVVQAFDSSNVDGLLLASTGCLYPCNVGPVAVVYPDGVWYGGLNRESVCAIVDRHLGSGEVVAEHRVSPDGTRQRRPTGATMLFSEEK